MTRENLFEVNIIQNKSTMQQKQHGLSTVHQVPFADLSQLPLQSEQHMIYESV